MARFQLPHSLQTALSVVLIGGTGLLASGCGTNAATGSQIYPIRVWRNGQGIDPFRSTFRQFQKSNPNATATLQSDFGQTNYELAALASLASKTGPEIWSYPDGWIGDEADKVVSLPENFFGDPKKNNGKVMSDVLKESYPTSIVNQLIDGNGDVLGIPSNADPLRIYINTDILSSSLQEYKKSLGINYNDAQYQAVRKLLTGAPDTWDTLLRQIPYIVQRSGSTINRSAIALGTADNIPNADAILQLLMFQNGAEIVNSDRNRSAFSNQQTTPSGGIVRPGEKALDFYAEFSNPSKATYTWNPSMPQTIDAFAQGKTAMVIDYANFGSDVKTKYPKFHFDIAPVPQITGSATPVNLSRFSVDSVTKNASSINLSEQLLYLMSDSGVSADLASQNRLQSPYVKTLTKKNDLLSLEVLTSRTVFKRHHSDFDAAFLQMIRDISQNGSTVSGAIDQGATKINALLAPVAAIPTANFSSH